jgi:phosphohistidine phosphatase
LILYILQHGEAEPKEVDPERPLSGQGVQDIRKLAAHLKNTGIQPGKIFHSGKLRAAQSARLIADVLSPGLEPVPSDGLNPNDDPSVIARDINSADETLLLASHMPFVSCLCSTLLTGTTNADFASLPGTLFCLEETDGKWRLAWMLRPDLL